MGLTLTIENHPNLPDGGPLSISVTGKRGIEFGRDKHLDWSLPDPTRFISGKHCEVRYQNGEYLLYDVSTNGTFLNGAQNRMQSPHRLRTGDRLTVGDFIIVSVIEGEAGGGEADFDAPPARDSAAMWDAEGDIAPPVDPKSLRPPSTSRPVQSDFLEQAMGSPDLYDLRGARSSGNAAPLPPAAALDPYASPAAPPPQDSDFDWAPPVARPAPVVEAAPPAPSPRRAAAPLQSGVWGDDAGDFMPPPAASPAPAPPPNAAAAAAPELFQAVAPMPAGVAADPAPPAALPVVSANPFLQAPPPASPPAAPPAASPAPSAPQMPPSAPPPAGLTGVAADLGGEFMARFAAAAGVSPGVLAGQDPLEVAQKAGEILHAVVAEMMQLLGARNEARRISRSSSQTMIQALDNNPLKFSPTPEDALRIMLGPPTRSYLDAKRALDQGFHDLKTHQMQTYSAMQAAMRRLAGELSPEAIEKSLPGGGGLAERLGSRRGRLWEAYLARWNAKTEHHDDGLVDVFMLYFSDCYDRSLERKD